jgi:hypothetical protein
MKLFEITVKIIKVDDEDKPAIGWMKPKVLYPVYSIFNRTEKIEQKPGFKITTWLLVAEKDGIRLDWINAQGVDYAGE